jgi:hypothetical protein
VNPVGHEGRLLSLSKRWWINSQAARAKQLATLEKAIGKVRGFLQGHEDKVGASGRIKQSNMTDNESAKMRTSKGVMQGYTAVALVDAKHQVVVNAAAYGEGQEHGLLIPMIEGAQNSWLAVSYKALARWMLQEAAANAFVRAAPLVSRRRARRLVGSTGER